MNVFISYSIKDKPFVEKLKNDLLRSDIDVWYIEENIKPGDSFFDKIKAAIKKADVFLVILSSDGLKSKWIKSEVALALSKYSIEKPYKIIPVVIDKEVYKQKEDIPIILQDILWADLSSKENYNKNIKLLIRAIKDTSLEKNNKNKILQSELEFLLAQEKLLQDERLRFNEKQKLRTAKIYLTLLTSIISITGITISIFLIQQSGNNLLEISYLKDSKLLNIILGFILGVVTSFFISYFYSSLSRLSENKQHKEMNQE